MFFYLDFNGTHCEKELPCHKAICKNNGTCHNVGTAHKCRCKPGWTGKMFFVSCLDVGFCCLSDTVTYETFILTRFFLVPKTDLLVLNC